MAISKKILLGLYKNLFAASDASYKGEIIRLQKVGGLKAYRIGKLLLIEQNPETDSKYAKMAKKGSKIMWVIDTSRNKYLYRVVDGKIKVL